MSCPSDTPQNRKKKKIFFCPENPTSIFIVFFHVFFMFFHVFYFFHSFFSSFFFQSKHNKTNQIKSNQIKSNQKTMLNNNNLAQMRLDDVKNNIPVAPPVAAPGAPVAAPGAPVAAPGAVGYFVGIAGANHVPGAAIIQPCFSEFKNSDSDYISYLQRIQFNNVIDFEAFNRDVRSRFAHVITIGGHTGAYKLTEIKKTITKLIALKSKFSFIFFLQINKMISLT